MCVCVWGGGVARLCVLWERDREGVRRVVVRERLCVSVCVVEVGVFCFVCVLW